MNLSNETEKFFFILLGNYISSCYGKDFTTFEILRKPLKFPLKKKDNYLVAKIPKGIPWEETVFFLDDSFVTRTKDVPVQKGLQNADERSDFFLINFGAIQELITGDSTLQVNEGALCYWPFFRFVTEPFVFDINNNPSKYISNAIAYLLRSNGLENKLEHLSEEKFEITVLGTHQLISRISLFGKESLDKFEVFGKDLVSSFDFSQKKLLIAKPHCPICFDALFKTDFQELLNIRVNKNDEQIEMTYEG
ncbi:hypothetical protein N9V13_05590 [Betaproteobacteria bacterium]|nr:hypothetical protein [Betaproteobacteria bacterium]